MNARCHWEYDRDIGRWFMPGCMGGAVYGQSQCTCGEHSRLELEEAVNALSDQVATLIARLPPSVKEET